MEDSDRKRNLADALSRTDSLIDRFSDILKGDLSGQEHPKRDFTATANRIIDGPTKVKALPQAQASHALQVQVTPQTQTTRMDGFNARPSATASTMRVKDDERLHMSFNSLLQDCQNCRRCGLCKGRKNVVFGSGNVERPIVMIVGEGPGEEEDIMGQPFVGKAGKYLDSWLSPISLSRDNIYITNIVKCRPPQNRDPHPEEKTACYPFLQQQIEIIHPQAILCLGKHASNFLTGQLDATMGAMHGRFYFFDGIPVICTYHPAAVLRNLALKRPVWEDLKKLARYLGLPIQGRSK